ncbi:MAG: hypothetical protein V1808_03090 [Candidatus Daviesbacteria bacterium]
MDQSSQNKIPIQEFVENLNSDLITNGYLTPSIKEFIEGLQANQSLVSPQNPGQINSQILNFAKPEGNLLPNLFLLSQLLSYFSFSPEVVEEIGNNLLNYLEISYNQSLKEEERDINSRAQAWNILFLIQSQFSQNLQERFHNLAMKVQELQTENKYIRNQIDERLSR